MKVEIDVPDQLLKGFFDNLTYYLSLEDFVSEKLREELKNHGQGADSHPDTKIKRNEMKRNEKE